MPKNNIEGNTPKDAVPDWVKEEYQKDANKNKRVAKGIGLAKLKGSTKQIEWAENLRKRILDKAWQFKTMFPDESIRWLETRCEASFWIDNKNTSMNALSMFVKNKMKERNDKFWESGVIK